MTPRGIKPIVREVAQEGGVERLTPVWPRPPAEPHELAAMPDATAKGDNALLAIEEAIGGES